MNYKAMILSCLLLALFSSHILADDSVANGSMLEQVMRGLSTVKESKATFVETKKTTFLKEPLVMKGRLVYKKPDYLEKHIEFPQASSFIVNGSEVITQKSGEEQVSLSLYQYPVLQAFIESLRSTFAGDLKRLYEYYDVSFNGVLSKWKIILIPVDEEIESYIKDIIIEGRDTLITRITTTDTNNDFSVMVIKDDLDEK